MKKNPNHPAAPAPWPQVATEAMALPRAAAPLSTTLILADALVQQLRAVHTTYHDQLFGPWTVTSTNQIPHKRNT